MIGQYAPNLLNFRMIDSVQINSRLITGYFKKNLGN